MLSAMSPLCTHSSYTHLRENKARQNLRAVSLCVCLLALPVQWAKADPFSSVASGMFGMMGSMANFMAQMMLPNSHWVSPSSLYGVYGMNPMPAAPFAVMPGLGATMPSYNSPHAPGYSGQMGAAQTNSLNYWLNGQWHATTGEVLQISGKNFILVSRQATMVGYVTSNEDLLSFYVPQVNQSLLFRVKLASNRLMLIAPNGTALTFNKPGM